MSLGRLVQNVVGSPHLVAELRTNLVCAEDSNSGNIWVPPRIVDDYYTHSSVKLFIPYDI